VAQVPVSILGKIFKTNLLPSKSAKVAIDKSVFNKLKLGAFDPTFGNSPDVFIGFPPNVIVAILFF
jgi:hypothetical protein